MRGLLHGWTFREPVQLEAFIRCPVEEATARQNPGSGSRGRTWAGRVALRLELERILGCGRLKGNTGGLSVAFKVSEMLRHNNRGAMDCSALGLSNMSSYKRCEDQRVTTSSR